MPNPPPSPQCVPREWLPYLTGKCFEFALALHEKMPQAAFVALGNPQFPDHVALRLADRFFDVRGELGFAEFIQGIEGGARMTPSDVHTVGRDAVAFHCGYGGMDTPYPRLPRAFAKARYATFEPSVQALTGAPTRRRRGP